MILTLSLDPAVEHLFPVPTLEPGRVYRTDKAFTTVSSRGINLARALHDLGARVTAVVVAGGRRGREIEERLIEEGLPHRIVGVRRESRVAVSLYGGGQRTAVQGVEPPLTDPDIEAVLATLRGLAPARCVALAGSTARPDLFRRVAAMGVPLVLACCGQALRDCLRVGNVLVAAPDRYECLDVLGCEDPLRGMRSLARGGARWAVVLEDDLASTTFRAGGRLYRVRGPGVEVLQPGGADDALLAGLIFALDRGPRRAVAFAVACGLHSLQRPDVAHVDPAACESLALQLEVEEIGPASPEGGL
ncbi:MAG: PfkB family carbohydrate kinase [Pseudomonadota bacterium]